MSNKTIIVLGNGFSIGLIEELCISDQVDLKNLFSKGDEVSWPDNNEKGFLSRKYCENLWTLGARTNMTADESSKFISDIITCLNVFNFASENAESSVEFLNPENIYIKAHNELSTYLRNLFIYYNSLVSDIDLLKVIDKVALLNYIDKQLSKGSQIVLITYNYDIFLERLLKLKKKKFCMCGFQKPGKMRIKIIKPHGSISFVSKIKSVPGKNFEIKNTLTSVVEPIYSLSIEYILNRDDSLINAIIPPAGDSNRIKNGWAYDIRQVLKDEIRSVGPKDRLIIYGLSYDHVDRMELDEIITSVNPGIEVKYINPYPSTTLNAVLSGLFKNYVHLKRSKSLIEDRK